MFKDEYKFEMSAINPSVELINRTKSGLTEEVRQAKKRPLLRPLIAVATAAAVALLMLGGSLMLLTNGDGNSFTVVAYVAEEEPDGTITTQNRFYLNGGDTDAEIIGGISMIVRQGDWQEQNLEAIRHYIYKNVAFRIEGENVRSVTLNVDKGHFGMLIDTGNDRFRWEVEHFGSKYTTNPDEHPMLIWGIDVTGNLYRRVNEETGEVDIILSGQRLTLPDVVITATVTFEDGEVQERTILQDFSYLCGTVVPAPQ